MRIVSFRAGCTRAMRLLDRVHRAVLAELDLRPGSGDGDDATRGRGGGRNVFAVRAVAGGGKTTAAAGRLRRKSRQRRRLATPRVTDVCVCAREAANCVTMKLARSEE